jgi:hypothetical protein
VMGLALMQARLRLAATTCPMRMTSAHPTPPQASTAVPKNHHHHHHHQQQQPLKTTYAQPNSPARHIPEMSSAFYQLPAFYQPSRFLPAPPPVSGFYHSPPDLPGFPWLAPYTRFLVHEPTPRASSQ